MACSCRKTKKETQELAASKQAAREAVRAARIGVKAPTPIPAPSFTPEPVTLNR